MNVSDRIHGAALMQIVKHPSFTALNRARDNAYGHYVINDGVFVFMKYNRRENPPWIFRFPDEDVKRLRKDIDQSRRTFLVLVCGRADSSARGLGNREFACALDAVEIASLLELRSPQPRQQGLRVERCRDASMLVCSPKTGKKGLIITQSSYPGKLLA